MTEAEVVRDPLRPPYAKLRRAVARQIEAERAVAGVSDPVTESDVDRYLEEQLPMIVRKLRLFLRVDAKSRAARSAPTARAA